MGEPADSSNLSAIADARFELRARLGAGGMGVVYRAHDKVRNMDVALKTMLSADGDALYRFKHEFRSLTDIVHDNLVTLYELRSTEDSWFFTMELVEGVDFLRFVRPYAASSAEDATDASGSACFPSIDGAADATRTIDATVAGTRVSAASNCAGGVVSLRQQIIDAPLDLKRLQTSLVQLVAAVDALHRAGKLHLDIKPSNVLVEHGGRVVVCDFGLVTDKTADKEAENLRLRGTPAYMSPEQAAGRSPCEASDWYAVGVVLYEALTGRLPFTGQVHDVLERKQSELPESPVVLNPALPSDLSELCMDLLAIEAEGRPESSVILEILGRGAEHQVSAQRAPAADTSIFVGRQSELTALRAALTDSRDHSVAVFVHGLSGFGKSALVRKFLDDVAADSRTIILEGRCYQRESVPYKALDALVDALSGHMLLSDGNAASLPADIMALARLFPVLRRVPAVAAYQSTKAVPPDAQELRMRAFAALRELLDQLSQDAPTVIYIDDLQWGDIDSAAFLNDLIHDPQAPRVLFVATYRSDEVDVSPLLQSILQRSTVDGRRGDMRSISPAALSSEEVQQLVRAVCGPDDETREQHVAEIANEAAGNPFFVVELARARAAGYGHATAVSGSLDDVLGERIARLPRTAQSLLRAAAVAGRPVPVSLLSRVCRLRDQAMTLAKLQAEHLIRLRRVDQIEEIETYHDRIRETVVNGLDEKDSRRIHRRLARALESSRRVDPLALVEHWIGAGDREKAGYYAALAAKQAEDALAFDRAAHHYRLVLKLQDLDAEQRRAIQVRLGVVLTAAGDLGAGSRAFVDAADGAAADVALDLRRRAMEGYLRAGDVANGLELSKGVIAALPIRLPTTRFGLLATILWHRTLIKLRGVRFERKPPEQISQESLRQLDVYWSLNSGLAMTNPMLALTVQSHYSRAALRSGDPYRASLAVGLEVPFRSQNGCIAIPEVDQLAKLATELAQESGEPTAIGTVASLTGFSAFLTGRWQRCVDHTRTAERILLEHGASVSFEISFSRLYELSALMVLGRYKEVAELVPELLREASDRGDEFFATRVRSWRSNIAWLVQDQPAEARRQALAIVDLPDDRGVHYYNKTDTHMRIDLYEGNGPEAWRRSQKVWPELKRTMLLRVESVRAFATYTRARCALAGAVAGIDEKRLTREALRCARRLSRERVGYATAFSAMVRGGAAALAGDEVTAGDHLRRAVFIFDSSEMSGHATVARCRLGKLLGGDEGERLVAEGLAVFCQEAVRNPEAFCSLYAPGFSR